MINVDRPKNGHVKNCNFIKIRAMTFLMSFIIGEKQKNVCADEYLERIIEIYL